MFSPSPHFFPLPLFFPLSPFIPPLPPCVSSVVGKALLAGWALLSLKCFPPPPIFSPSPFSSPSPPLFPLPPCPVVGKALLAGWALSLNWNPGLIPLEFTHDRPARYARSPWNLRTIALVYTMRGAKATPNPALHTLAPLPNLSPPTKPQPTDGALGCPGQLECVEWLNTSCRPKNTNVIYSPAGLWPMAC